MPIEPFRVGGVLALLLGLIGSVLGAPAAHAAAADFVLPVAETYSRGQSPVGSVAGRLYVLDDQDGKLRSSADGVSWSAAAHVPAFTEGRLIDDRYVSSDYDEDRVVAYPLPSGAPILREATGSVEGIGYSGFVEERYDDGAYHVDLATGNSTKLSVAPPPTDGSSTSGWEITETVAVRSLTTYVNNGDEHQTQIAVAPLDGSAGPPPVTLDPVPWTVVGLDKIWYPAITSGELTLCSSPLTALSFSCEALFTAANIESVHDVALHVLQDRVMVSFHGRDGSPYLVTNGGPVKLSFPTGTVLPFGRLRLQADTDRLLTIGTIGGVHAAFAVAVDGSTSRVATGPQITAIPQEVALGGDTMFVMDRRPSVAQHGRAVWRRNATPAGVGAESLLPVRATSVRASAGRLAVTESEREYVTWFDRGTRGRSVPGWLGSNVSGPFILVAADSEGNQRFLYRADGKKLGPADQGLPWPMSSNLFGPKWATAVDQRVCARDLSLSPPTTVCGPETANHYRGTESIWGDWIAWIESEPDLEGTSVHAYNLKTKVHRTEFVAEGTYTFAMSDGVLLFRRRPADVVAWNFASGTTPEVLGQGMPLALDGTRAVWVDQNGAAHLTVLDGVDLSAPRLLGTIAPTSFTPASTATGTWSPQFDATKALDAGVVEIRSGSTLVRTLSTVATSDGSIRGVTWDGRNATGALVAPGSYTWTLRAAATDGSGSLTNLDGTAAPTGTLTVAGVLTSAVPKVTGRAVYGQKLTAVPGSWGPAPVILRYQWLCDGKTVGKATASTYTLKSTDLGKRVSVRITGSKAFYPSLTRTSGATSKIVPARLTTTPAPGITGSAKVGSTLRAVPGSWKPSPVSLSYRWKRNGASIAGGTKSSYRLTKADRGKRLTVSVTGRKTGYVTMTRTSVATAKVG